MVFVINKCRITLQIAAALASFLLITAQSINWDSSCGTTRGCFPECTTGCEYLVTWYTSGSVTYFDLKAKESNSNVFLAIGFSKDRRMGDDSVIGCIVPGSNTVQVYYNEGTKSKELPTVTLGERKTSPPHGHDVHSNPTLGLLNPEVSHTGGVITCTFIRDVKNVNNTDTYFDLNDDYYLMLVVGDVKEKDGGSYKLDKHKKIPWMSDSVVDFNSNKTYGLYKLNSPVVKLHGIMMTLVWMLLVIVGMVTARYNREMFQGQKLCGEDVWFQVHRAVMVTALVFAFVGFIPIFVEIEGYSQILEGNVGVKAHPVLGIIVTVLLCINPSMAFVRPGHNHKFRWIFNWVHRAVGAVAQILAITTVFIGFRLERAMLSNTIIYVTIAHLVIVMIICVVLELHKLISDQENRQQSSLLTLPFILLLILGVVALIFEIAILGLIAAS